MSLAGAIRIGAKRSGARLRHVNVPGLVELGERAVVAFSDLTGLPMPKVREIIRAQLVKGMHPSWFEGEIDGFRFFETWLAYVKLYREQGYEPPGLRLVDGSWTPERSGRRKRKPAGPVELRLVQGGAR